LPLDFFILVLLVLAALWTVITRSLLRSAIGLALTSAILTIVMFRMRAPLAGVFELSVCAGLIPVLFVSVISLTQPLTYKEVLEHMKVRLKRFWALPLVVVVLGIALIFVSIKARVNVPLPTNQTDVRFLLWHLRQFDLLGQVIILFSGVLGVVILFKERKKSG